MSIKKGLFIAFEGIDGCGKSTQVIKLAEHILKLDKHNHVLITREPYKDKNIRKILFKDKDPYSKSRKLAKMFVDDRKKHVKEIILPTLRKGIHVITDRYALSTIAYQGSQGIPIEDLIKMHNGLPKPDIIFLIDTPVNLAIKRMSKDDNRDEERKFENNTEFMEKLRKTYLKINLSKKFNMAVIGGAYKADDIFNKQIKPCFNRIYNEQQ